MFHEINKETSARKRYKQYKYYLNNKTTGTNIKTQEKYIGIWDA